MRRIELPDVTLEVDVRGSGEPVVLIQTALTADEFAPLARRPELADVYQIVHYHRRGYAGSSPVEGPGSIERDALDCQRLLTALGIERAHLVGVSYSAAVALQVAARSPDRVRTLTVMEPPPAHIADAAEFRAANVRLLEAYHRDGSAATLDSFLGWLIGPDWRTEIERHIPGAVAQMERDAGTFFGADIPALLDWRFGPPDAERITHPVLYIGGTESGPWFAAVRQLVLRWLPQAEDVVVAGADHSLAITHPEPIATAMRDFLRRHPVSSGG